MLLAAIAGFHRADSLHGVASCMASLALLYQVCNRLTEAKLQYCEALNLFARLGDRSNIARTLGNLGLISKEEGDMKAAIGYQEQALAGYRELQDSHGEATTLVNLAQLHKVQGERAQTDEYARRARRICADRGYQDRLMRLDRSLAAMPESYSVD